MDLEEEIVVKNKDRALRRHHAARLKKNRSKHSIMQWVHGKPHEVKSLGKHFQTPSACSCRLCGNPRKWFNQKTHQEEKLLSKDHD